MSDAMIDITSMTDADLDDLLGMGGAPEAVTADERDLLVALCRRAGTVAYCDAIASGPQFRIRMVRKGSRRLADVKVYDSEIYDLAARGLVAVDLPGLRFTITPAGRRAVAA